ncbi:MAG: hypothetical protein ACK58T_15835, partial [Phycisphaerae bacterium]
MQRMNNGVAVGMMSVVAACGLAASANAQVYQRGYGTQQPEIQLDITDTRECDYARVGYRTARSTGAGGVDSTRALSEDRDGS